MEKRTPSFDICIVCALKTEADAVASEFSSRCGREFKSAFTRSDHYVYRYTTIHNQYREPLTILLICLPRPGPQETCLLVKSLLQEFRPRFAAMTGIGAGYKEDVKLSDLVAASYAFHYEEGKVEIDEDGQTIFLPEWLTHGTAKRVLQYLQDFDAWEEPVAEMKRDMLGRDLMNDERPKCHIGPVASGMAVRKDTPFPELKTHNRKVMFLEQEVAAFYQTLHEFPHVYPLAVKGACDHADMSKNDTYHNYAAQASAVYLLFFIQKYVTEQTMPRWNAPSPSIRVGPSGVWNVLHTLNTLLIKQTRLAIFMYWLNMALGLLLLMAILVAIGLDSNAPDRLTFANALGNAAYLASLVICSIDLLVLLACRQWRWLVGLLVVVAGVYLSNNIFVFGRYIYFVAAILPLVFSFGWFYISRRAIVMQP